MSEVEQALLQAQSHVSRQQFAGKHEQDRADAVEWLRKWSPLVDRIRRKREKQVHAGTVVVNEDG